jgi:hypothetical protein
MKSSFCQQEVRWSRAGSGVVLHCGVGVLGRAGDRGDVSAVVGAGVEARVRTEVGAGVGVRYGVGVSVGVSAGVAA